MPCYTVQPAALSLSPLSSITAVHYQWAVAHLVGNYLHAACSTASALLIHCAAHIL